MKKLLIAALVLGSAMCANAEESFAPEAGDFSTEIQFTPFKSTGESFSMTVLQGRYFFSNNDAFIIELGLSGDHNKEVPDTDHDNIFTKDYSGRFQLNIGYQRHFYNYKRIDLYVGGTEHATGHLIYSRFWNKFLYDLGKVCENEPFRKLVNQGMIQGRSNFVYRIKDTNTFVSLNLKKDYDVTPIHVDVNIVNNDQLDIDAFRKWRPEYADAEFILEDGKYVCGWAVEKMSKSMFNVVNPDDIVERYGADTLRLYEMFLGPVEQSKPWDTNGSDGVNRFIKKLWNLFYKGDTLLVNDDKPSAEALKSIHKLIKKVTGDIENFSYNTSVSAFMICVNELGAMKCHSREVLADLLVLLAPFAPHVSEELWHAIGNEGTICDAVWPEWNEEYLKESNVNYAVSFNGKARFNISVPADMPSAEVEKTALAHEGAAKWVEGKTIRKIIVVPGKIVNIVVG